MGSGSRRLRWWVTGGAVAALAGAVTWAATGEATGAVPSGARRAAMEASPRWRGDRFENPLPRAPMPFWESLVTWARGAANTRPDGPVPIVTRSGRDFSSPPASGLRITWLGHSTSLVEIDGARFLLDPMWGERASPFRWVGPRRFHPPPLPLSELPPVDAVVISHDHYDHLDHGTVVALRDRVPLWVVPLGVGAHLERWGVPDARIVERDWWGEVVVGGVRVVATPARHFSGRSVLMLRQDQTLWAGWVLAGPSRRVYYSGDTAMFPGFADIGARLGPFDAVLLDTGAYHRLWADVHLGPEQAVAARQAIGSGLFVPVHWGTFDLAIHSWTEPVERVLAAAAAARIPVAVPRPGESVEPAEPPAVTRWWPAVPWQTASQAPVVSSGLGG